MKRTREKQMRKAIFGMLAAFILVSAVFSGCIAGNTQEKTGNTQQKNGALAEAPAEDKGAEFMKTKQALLGNMKLYQGNFHSHTANSDGTGTPEEAFKWAKDDAKFDFYAITDHAEYLTPISWGDTGVQADKFNKDGEFVAVRGFEWSNPYYGHINVFETGDYTNAILAPVLELFYLWVDTNNAIAQFNHPSREPGIFNNFKYDASVADNFFMVETGNKDDGNVGNDYYPYYVQALDLGWRVAPSSSQDNHELKSNSHRTFVVAGELTRNGIFDAVKARRVYSSDDANMEIIFKLGEIWMGSEAKAGKANFTVLINDDENISKVEIITNGGKVAAELSLQSGAGNRRIAWNPEIDAKPGSYYFARVTEIDENKDERHGIQIAVTAPIWIG